MKEITKIRLQEAEDFCKKEGKSLEFTIEFMKDFADVDHDCVMNYLYKTRDKRGKE